MNTLVMYENVIPLLAPQDIVATETNTPWMDLKLAHEAAFEIFFGSITAASADESITVTVEAATSAASTSAVTIPFQYRLSDAVNSNVWNAVTDGASSGVSIATTDDNKILHIKIDPAAVAADKADGRWVRAIIKPNAEGTATLVAVIGRIWPRYKQTTFNSAT